MAKKLSRKAVQAVLAGAKEVIGYEFRVIVSKKKSGKYSATIASRNGEIVMCQETVNEKASAEYIAARLISGGLRAKYIEVESSPISKSKPICLKPCIGSRYVLDDGRIGVLTHKNSNSMWFKMNNSKLRLDFDTTNDMQVYFSKLKEVSNG